MHRTRPDGSRNRSAGSVGGSRAGRYPRKSPRRLLSLREKRQPLSRHRVPHARHRRRECLARRPSPPTPLDRSRLGTTLRPGPRTAPGPSLAYHPRIHGRIVIKSQRISCSTPTCFKRVFRAFVSPPIETAENAEIAEQKNCDSPRHLLGALRVLYGSLPESSVAGLSVSW